MAALEDVRLIRHPRARRLKLKVDLLSGQVILTAPRYASRAQTQAFLEENALWVQEQQLRLTPAQPFAPGLALTLFGEPVVLLHDPALRGLGRLENGALTIGGAPDMFARRCMATIRALAQQRFSVWADEYAARLGLPPTLIRVKDTRSRWGSCSWRGGISLSWRLAMAPLDVAHYVVAHEVAHRIELNHGPRFWALVQQLVGPVTQQRNWLVQKGYLLHRVGVAGLPPRA